MLSLFFIVGGQKFQLKSNAALLYMVMLKSVSIHIFKKSFEKKQIKFRVMCRVRGLDHTVDCDYLSIKAV